MLKVNLRDSLGAVVKIASVDESEPWRPVVHEGIEYRTGGLGSSVGAQPMRTSYHPVAK